MYKRQFLNRPEDLLASPSDKLQSISLRMPKALNYAIQAKRLNSERIMAGLRSNLLKNVMTIAQNLFDDQHISAYDEVRALEKENKLVDLLNN